MKKIGESVTKYLKYSIEGYTDKQIEYETYIVDYCRMQPDVWRLRTKNEQSNSQRIK